jgi:hypothetical protein
MRLAYVICCGLGIVLPACKEEAPTPFLKIVGGSFIFNYRYSKMSYGFVARQLKPLPEGSMLEASFDLPETERKYVITQTARTGHLQYSVDSEARGGG